MICRLYGLASRLPGLVSALVIATAAVAWAGGDPWKSKPYHQWDSKDLQRIVNDSPWAKVVHVDASWKTSEGAEQSDSGRPTGGIRPGMGGQQMGGTPPGPAGNPQDAASPQANFVVRWVSSRTIREAGLRQAILSGRMKPEDADRELAHPVDAYQLLVAGADMKPFTNIDEGDLKRGALLTTRKSKQRIVPASIVVEHTPDGRGVEAIIFSFPKKSLTGEATIATDEKAADFTCAAGTVRIQATFDVSKMDDPQGRDL